MLSPDGSTRAFDSRAQGTVFGDGAAVVLLKRLSDAIADIQLKQRTDLNYNKIGAEQHDSILQAGIALQKAGIIKADVDVKKALDDLIDAKAAFTN